MKEIHPSACERCGKPLNLAAVMMPRFGLVPVDCPHCKHHHLMSPLDLSKARNGMPRLRFSPQREAGFWDQVRRFIAS